MLDDTDDEKVRHDVDKTAPALFVRLSAPVGKERTCEMSFGVPLDMRVADINKYIDKVMLCVDHQNNIGLMLFIKESIAIAEKQIRDNMAHIASYQQKIESEWYERGRKGECHPTASQAAEIKNFQTTIKDRRENVIPKLQAQLAEVEEAIARGK